MGKVKKATTPRTSSRRHDSVIFEFYNMETAVEYTGSVSVSADSMTIDIPAQTGTQTCLIKGRRESHLYRGHNSCVEKDPVEVEATWCDVGDGYLCLWIEEGTEYVVRFTLPR